jgi:hypothetical protein
VLHVLHKSSSKLYLFNSIFFDVLFTGTVIANTAILSAAGIPSNCHGMTRSNCPFIPFPVPFYFTQLQLIPFPDSPGDTPNNPAPGFVTVRFGLDTLGNYGELDKYCSLPQAAFSLSIIVM